MPQSVRFVAGAEWQQFRFGITQFSGTNGNERWAVSLVGGPPPGPFTFQIDDMRIEWSSMFIDTVGHSTTASTYYHPSGNLLALVKIAYLEGIPHSEALPGVG